MKLKLNLSRRQRSEVHQIVFRGAAKRTTRREFGRQVYLSMQISAAPALGKRGGHYLPDPCASILAGANRPSPSRLQAEWPPPPPTSQQLNGGTITRALFLCGCKTPAESDFFVFVFVFSSLVFLLRSAKLELLVSNMSDGQFGCCCCRFYACWQTQQQQLNLSS